MGIILIWAVVLLASAVTLAAVVGTGPPGGAEILDALGRVTGIVGLVMLLLAAALSARVPGFDRWFGGLTRLWKTHHRLGAGSLVLLLAHPLLLALSSSGEGVDAAVALLFPPFAEWEIWSGWLALL
ncbi:MAG: oxidoreductase, partial [Wenzhouxiangellaceae bacterium]